MKCSFRLTDIILIFLYIIPLETNTASHINDNTYLLQSTNIVSDNLYIFERVMN